jgi:RNA polymerase sigma-70 factor (ECF subfamily)
MADARDRSTALERFDELYTRYARTLHDYFVGRTSDAELARDLVQETCVRLWRAIDEVGELAEERQRAWLFTVARNMLVDEYRARASRAARQDAVAVLQRAEPSHVPALDADLGSAESVRDVDAAIARLPEPLREVLVLQVLGERNSTEIGEILGRPAGTVRYQLAQARRLLAHELRLVDAQERA